jgi:hypothetical protein
MCTWQIFLIGVKTFHVKVDAQWARLATEHSNKSMDSGNPTFLMGGVQLRPSWPSIICLCHLSKRLLLIDPSQVLGLSKIIICIQYIMITLNYYDYDMTHCIFWVLWLQLNTI